MHARRLGETDLMVSILGLGSSPFRNLPPRKCADLLEQAVDLGINYYDTARSYVHGEEAVGLLPAAVSKQLVVATKTGARGGKRCLDDLQCSLRTMTRDRVDVWMTHMVQSEEEYELCTALGGFCDIASAARQAGLIRALGASFHARTDLILRAVQERAFDVVMFPLNIIGRETVYGASIASYRDVLLPAAMKHGVGVVVMKTLAAGELRHGATKLGFVADPVSERDVAGGAIRYATLHPGVTTAVVGMANSTELPRNVAAVEGVDDSKLGEFGRWTRWAEALGKGPCPRCGDCLEVCPEGIEIPKIMRLHDQFRYLGMESVAIHLYRHLKVTAAACTRCGRCTEICPVSCDVELLLEVAHGDLGIRTELNATQDDTLSYSGHGS